MLSKANIKMGYRFHDQGYHEFMTVLAVQDDGVIFSKEDGLHFYTFQYLNENGYGWFDPDNHQTFTLRPKLENEKTK